MQVGVVWLRLEICVPEVVRFCYLTAAKMRRVPVDSKLLARLQSQCARVPEVMVRAGGGGGVEARSMLTVNSSSVPELQGHFPTRPVVPAVVLLDAMFQTAAALSTDALSVAQVHRARFMRVARPGDRVHVSVVHDEQRGVYDAKATCDYTGEVATASFSTDSRKVP